MTYWVEGQGEARSEDRGRRQARKTPDDDAALQNVKQLFSKKLNDAKAIKVTFADASNTCLTLLNDIANEKSWAWARGTNTLRNGLTDWDNKLMIQKHFHDHRKGIATKMLMEEQR